MGIDITQEDLIRLNDVRKLKCLPQGKSGKRIALCTLYRWAMGGVGGVRLETLKVGGSLCTSVDALQRFFEALSNKNNFASEATTNSFAPTSALRRRQIEAANKRLDEILYPKGHKPTAMDAEMTEAMKDPALAHLPPRERRRHLETERRLL